jgi:hypothetical protein
MISRKAKTPASEGRENSRSVDGTSGCGVAVSGFVRREGGTGER